MRTGSGSRAVVHRIVVRVCRRAGLFRRAPRAGGRRTIVLFALVLRRYLVLFQVLGILLGIARALFALLRPLRPFLGVGSFVFIRIARCGCRGGFCFRVVLDHARGDSRADQPARGDRAFRVSGGLVAQFPGESVPCDFLRKNRVLGDFFGGLFRVRRPCGRRSNPFAIVCDHGKAVHVIVYNAHADAEGFCAFAACRFAAGGIVNIGGVRGNNRSKPRRDIGFVIQGHNAVAIPVGESHHAGNADGIPLAGVLDAVFQIHGVVCRDFQGLCACQLHALARHNQAVATDVLDAYSGPKAHLAVLVFGAVSPFGVGGSLRRQLEGRPLHLALLPQQDNGVVLQGVDSHGA